MFDRVLYILTLISVMLLLACSNTRFVSVWLDKEHKIELIDNMLVVGVAENQIARRMFEDNFVSELTENNIRALSSYEFIPDGKNITRESVGKIVKSNNVDAIIVTHLVAIEEETVYHPPVTHVSPNTYYGHYYNYYPTIHGYTHSPGYYTTHKLVKLETSLYDARTASLIWSAQSSTFSPGSVQDVINPLIKLVIKEFNKQGFIVRNK